MLKKRGLALCASLFFCAAASHTAHAGVFFTNEADFNLAAGPLAGFEDFEAGNVGAGSVVIVPAPLDSTTDNAFFSPGDIAPGLSLRDGPGPGASGLALVGAGFAGVLSKAVGANLFVDQLVLEFSVPVDAVGFNALTIFDDDPELQIDVFSGATLLDSTTIESNQTTSYLGYISDGDFITSILLSSSIDEAEFVDNVRFGVRDSVQLSAPATSLLLGLGLAGLFLARRRIEPGRV